MRARRVRLHRENLPPSVPSVPTKSVSQKRQMALARSCSRPLQRLQPAKRQNTAGRPAREAFALQGVEDFLDRIAHACP